MTMIHQFFLFQVTLATTYIFPLLLSPSITCWQRADGVIIPSLSKQQSFPHQHSLRAPRPRGEVHGGSTSPKVPAADETSVIFRLGPGVIFTPCQLFPCPLPHVHLMLALLTPIKCCYSCTVPRLQVVPTVYGAGQLLVNYGSESAGVIWPHFTLTGPRCSVSRTSRLPPRKLLMNG